MARVLTNEKNYYDIANTIRQMKNVNTTYKPREMASALKDIYSNEVEGTLPLNFESNGMPLIDYRIDGASGGVGDKTNNLFDLKKAVKKKYINSNGNEATSLSPSPENTLNHSDYVSIDSNVNYTFTCNTSQNYSLENTIALCWFDQNKNILSRNTMNVRGNINNYSITAPSPSTAKYLIVNFIAYVDDAVFYLNEGTTTVFEPYGYKVPVVANGKNLLKPDGTPTTIRGVSWSYREDGAVVGERVSSNENVSSTFKSGSYIFSRFDTESTPGSSTYQSNISIDGVSHWGTGNYLFVLNEASTIRVVLRVYPNFTGTAIFKPMIRLSSIQESNYEPYHEPTTTNIYLDEPIEAKANIPSEYTEVEYLESTGTQYIDTGFVPNSNSGFKTKIVFTGHTTGIDDFVIGVRSNSTYGRFAYTCTSTTFYCSLGSTTSSSYRYNSNIPSTEIIECELNYKSSNKTITQGVEGLMPDKNNFNGEGLIFYLAGAYNAKGIPKYRAMRQYKCELTQGTEVVRDLVPCYRKSDNVAGLYDLVNNVFYTNQGTGNFIVGPIKENESISLSDTNTNIPTIEGTNTLTIDTTVQPSNVYVQAPKDSLKVSQIANRLEEI